jgi:GT2 family glycosyltransferase
MGDTTLVICSHLFERRFQLIAAVESAERQSLPPASIVVVIDGDLELADFACDSLRNRCIVVPRSERGGLSAARNCGLEYVKTDFVAFLDDDAVADTNWLERLRQAVSDDVLGVGGRSLPAWETQPRSFPDELLWVVGCSYEGLPAQVSVVRNVFGGCALYRTELFRDLGGFDRSLGRQPVGAGGGEETEFCLRATHANPAGRFLYVPTAIIYHAVPASRSTLRYILLRSMGEGTSKAHVRSRTVGHRALASESEYLTHTVVAGVRRRAKLAARGDLIAAAALSVLLLSVFTASLSFVLATIALNARRLRERLFAT